MFARILIVGALIATTMRADDPEGAKLLQRVCGHCHKLSIVTSRHLTKEAWQETVQAMVDKGADASDEDFAAVIEYLAKYYGPRSGAERLNVNKASPAQIAAFLEIPDSQAAAIVKYRETNGNFKTAGDLKKVPAIDSKKVDAKKDLLEF